MRKDFCALVAAIGMILLTTGCGQKGPLYLPPEPDTTDPQGVPVDVPETNQHVVGDALVGR